MAKYDEKWKVKGKFDLKKDKKKKKNDINFLKEKKKKEERKRDKKLRKASQCNHIARNTGKSHWKKIRTEDGTVIAKKCEICGATILANPEIISTDALKDSRLMYNTLVYIIRNKYKLSPEMDNKLADFLFYCNRMEDLFATMTADAEEYKEKRKAKKNKKKNKKKGKHSNGYSRIKY